MNYEFRFVLVALVILLSAFLLIRSNIVKHKTVLVIVSALMVAFSVFGVWKGIYANLANPPEWDFLTFWLDGHVAVSGQNFYDAGSYRAESLPRVPSNDFVSEIIDVGFRYPPFTMVLFLPLGYLGFGQAYLFWQAMNFGLCVLCAYLLWKVYLDGELGVSSLFVAPALLFMLSPTYATFLYAQTNFLVLLLFLLFWMFRTRDWSGIFMALSLMVKPYMVVFFLYPVIVRRWRMLFVAVSALIALTLLSGFMFGFDILYSFMFNNSIQNMPGYVYSEPVNQSLLAVVLRLSSVIGSSSPLFEPLYLGVSLALTAVTVIVGLGNHRESGGWLMVSILFLALLVYPASLGHYSIFLMIPILLLLRQPTQNAQWHIASLFLIFAMYFLSGYRSGDFTFFANALAWLISIVFVMEPKLRAGWVSPKPTL